MDCIVHGVGKSQTSERASFSLALRLLWDVHALAALHAALGILGPSAPQRKSCSRVIG